MPKQLELPDPDQRTYGTYRYVAAPDEDPRYKNHYSGRRRGASGMWELELEPAVSARAKRILGRVQAVRGGIVRVWDTIEVARDIEWLMERWPLVPTDALSAKRLAKSAHKHRRRENDITTILTTQTRMHLPQEPAKAPRDYQLQAVELLRSTGRLLLTDSRGLGKTYTGLLNSVHEDALPMLVIPPTHLPSRWEKEAQDAFPWLDVRTAKKSSPPPGWHPGMLPDVFIVPYSRLAGWADHLAGHIKTVVFDEVQELRHGVGTQKGIAAARVCDQATYKLGLTATPIYNYGGEIWNIIDILATGELGTGEEFTREWGSELANGKTFVKDPAALGSYLREQGLMLGRNRRDVGRELPPHVTVPMLIDSNPEALEKVKGDAREMARLILSDTASNMEKFQAAGNLDWKLREATGIGKAPYVAEFARVLLESEDKIVLFGWHRAVYEIWLDLLAEFKPVMYTGTESPKQKDAAQDAFVNGDARVLIMSLRSGSGVDGLQEASKVVVFGELDWSPQVHLQGIGRLDRDPSDADADLTLVEPTVAYYLNSADGSDPVLMETLGVKRRQSEPLINADGKLTAGQAPDAGRARALAKQILGIE